MEYVESVREMLEELRRALEERLATLMPTASPARRADLARALSDPDHRPDTDLLRRLLEEVGESAPIQLAIMQARDLLFARLWPRLFDSGREGASETAHALLLHFDREQASLVSALERTYRRKLRYAEANLEEERHARRLVQARDIWQQEGEILLYNYFWEMPVQAIVRLRHVHSTVLSVVRTRELVTAIAAGDEQRFIHTRLPDSDLCLRLEVEPGPSAGIVNLRIDKLFKRTRENRRDIRARCEHPPHVGLHFRKIGEAEARLRDFSASGLGMVLHERLSCRPGDRFRFSFSMERQRIEGEATVRWIRSAAELTYLGAEMERDPPTRRWLQLQVARRYRRVLSHLRMLGVPDLLI